MHGSPAIVTGVVVATEMESTSGTNFCTSASFIETLALGRTKHFCAMVFNAVRSQYQCYQTRELSTFISTSLS